MLNWGLKKIPLNPPLSKGDNCKRTRAGGGGASPQQRGAEDRVVNGECYVLNAK